MPVDPFDSPDVEEQTWDEVRKLLEEWEREDEAKEYHLAPPPADFGKTTKCECGAESARTTHSTWCPKWEK